MTQRQLPSAALVVTKYKLNGRHSARYKYKTYTTDDTRSRRQPESIVSRLKPLKGQRSAVKGTSHGIQSCTSHIKKTILPEVVDRIITEVCRGALSHPRLARDVRLPRKPLSAGTLFFKINARHDPDCGRTTILITHRNYMHHKIILQRRICGTQPKDSTKPGI